MHGSKRPLIMIPIVLVIAVVAWYMLRSDGAAENEVLQASGTVEALEVLVSPELAGRVAEVLVDKGDLVEVGDPLLRLDDELLQAQRSRASTGYDAAQAGLAAANTGVQMAQSALEMAQVGVEAAQVQYDMALTSARLAEAPARSLAWKQENPDEFSQPVWYFQRAEEITAAEAEVAAAREFLTVEEANFTQVISSAANADIKAAEERLAKARAAFLVAQEVLDRAEAQKDDALQEVAQILFDAAEAELEAAQADYDNILSETASDQVLEARARLAVAQERYEAALDRRSKLLTGAYALQVRAAEVALRQATEAVAQAKIGVTQAQAKLEQTSKAILQAQAELDLIDLQIEKLTVVAAISGVVISRNVEPGEVVQPGAPVITLGKLDDLRITVYVPEDRYGQIYLGQQARVSVDSFPGQTFEATVIFIAEQAEFTPRNVQTAEGRRSTVFAIELSIESETGKLKPGMPADVHFESP